MKDRPLYFFQAVATKRAEAGLSLRKLSKISGVGEATILRAERGLEVYYRTAYALSQSLGFSLGEVAPEPKYDEAAS
jgi:transcriptional regulator with XRE-family HTH domain